MNRILQLETHNQQLKNIIKKELTIDGETSCKNQRKFDFTKYILSSFSIISY